ncbi:hypothetical protein M0802_010449 [Mischocyttarus mexicanus]|nr:hypothetical protein M0802_010449 [Mischocyttarus mexicanus]
MPLRLRHHPGATSARYKKSKYLRKDAQLLGILRTTNMRFLLLTVLCSVAALTVAVQKPKREILPGDPRYGTDYHNHNHQENQLEVSKSLGGYVGSYSVLDDGVKQGYGPPNYQPSKPLNLDQHRTTVGNNAQVPVPAYGVPEVNQVDVLNKQYLSPAIEASKKVQTKTLTTFSKPVENAVLNKETVDNLTPSVKAPVTSYGDPVEVKTVENHQTPTSYEVPAVKTSVVPLLDTKVEQAVHPHDHLEEAKAIHKTQFTVPQVPDVSHQTPAVDSSLVLPINNFATSFTANTDFSNFAPPTISGHSTFNDHLHSQSDFDTAYQLYLRNIEQFPNLYVSPYTYGVPYQLPQSLYNPQNHQSLPSQLNNLLPYPLAGNSNLVKSTAHVKQLGPFGVLFPNFQLPQFPQFPNFGALFQLPTPAPATVEDGETLKTVQVQKPVEVHTLETTDNLFDTKPVALDTSLTKTSTVSVEKTSKEYIQPTDESGAYVY